MCFSTYADKFSKSADCTAFRKLACRQTARLMAESECESFEFRALFMERRCGDAGRRSRSEGTTLWAGGRGDDVSSLPAAHFVRDAVPVSSVAVLVRLCQTCERL